MANATYNRAERVQHVGEDLVHLALLLDKHHDGVKGALRLRSAALLHSLPGGSTHFLVDAGDAQGERSQVGTLIQLIKLIQDAVEFMDVFSGKLRRRLAGVLPTFQWRVLTSLHSLCRLAHLVHLATAVLLHTSASATESTYCAQRTQHGRLRSSGLPLERLGSGDGATAASALRF